MRVLDILHLFDFRHVPNSGDALDLVFATIKPSFAPPFLFLSLRGFEIFLLPGLVIGLLL
jgi:hypothetical protein